MDQFVPVRGTMDEALALFRAAHRWPPVVGSMDRGLAGDGASAGVRRRSLVGPMGPALVGAIGRWCQVLGDEAELNAQVRYRLELCAAGLTTNLLKYGGEACEGSRVHVQVVLDAHRLSLTLVDRCAPFDPLAAPPRTPAQRVEDMPVGGQGLHLLRSFTDERHYEHRDGCNRLTLVFELARPPSGAMDLGVLSQAAKAPIFQGVPAGALEPLLVGLPLLDVTEDLRLLQRGDANQSVMLVLQGSLHVSLDQSDSGDFIEVAAGECAGEMSVIDDQPVSAHVVAVAGTRLLLIDSLTFLDRVLAMPRVARNLMSAMAERMRRSDRLTISRMRQLMALEQARRELAFAHDIQSSLLPAESLFAGDVRLDCAGRMRPARDVGGDFYDLFFLDEHRLLFVIADVCGKGLPAALFMVRAIAAHQFITAFCGVLDLRTHRLQYVNAGHHPPLVAPAGQPFTYLEGPISPLVGMIPGLCDRSGELELAPGSALPLYTDGVTEAEDAERRLFGEARLLQCLQSQARAAAARLLDAVFAEVDAFAGGALRSDDNGQGTRPSSTAWQRLRSVVAAASAHGVSREAVFRSAARSSAQSPLMEVQLTLYASRPSEEARAAASSINELLLPPLLGRSVCGLHHPEEDVQRGAVGSVALLGT